MSNIFFIADTHFGHKNIIKFENEHRPFVSIEEHDEKLIENWNSVVTHKDIVWHLGDVAFSNPSFNLLDRLNGRKYLCMGNHDAQYGAKKFLKYFRDVMATKEFDGHILSHIPVHTSQFWRYRGNIHGHTHHKVVALDESFDDARYACVSVEQVGLTPVPYEIINRRLPKKAERE